MFQEAAHDEPHVLPGQPRTFPLVEFGEAQAQVGVDDAAAAPGGRVKQGAQHISDGRLHRQRQPVQHPHQENDQAGKDFAHGLRLYRVFTPGMLAA